MHYRVFHTTRYRYDAQVSQCQTAARLTPRALPWQRVHESTIETTPAATYVDHHKDYFGNDVTTFSILQPHDHFTTTASSLVEVDAHATWSSAQAWDTVRDRLAAHDSADTLEAFEFVLPSPFVPPLPALAAYAQPSFPPGRPLVDAAEHLAHRIHADFAYVPWVTTIDTPLADIIDARRGVCQDFSHVMIGALRSMRVAARYVSGYLRSGADYQGAEASHAWVSVFVPDQGWLDIDPTNDMRPSDGHVTVAWGRDYGDVAPIRGLALGGGSHLVDVEVRVVPVDASTVR